MKSIPAGLLAHYQNDTTTITTCWKVSLQGGSPATTLGFTDHDTDLVIDGLTYLARTGFLPSAYQTQSKGAVDNLEAQGFLDSSVITEQDILNGVWDYAEIEIFQVNWADLTQGKNILTKGHLGQISTERNIFTAELRGMANALAQSSAQTYTPNCSVEFGSAKCGIDIAAHRFSGTVTSVSSDGLTLFDTGRTEAGPAGNASTNISKASSAVVTSVAHGLARGAYVFFYDVLGMTQINGLFAAITAVATDSFTVNLNTTNFSTYTSGGTVSSNESGGYFAGGKITMTSGASNGLSMEIKESAPGMLLLQLQLSQGVAPGDTYSIVRGCTKRFNEDCIAKFNNAANFRGHPHIPGINKIIQTGGRI